MLGSEGDGLLIVGELVADEDRDRWSTWIFVTSAGWNGFRHIGQTLRVKDLRHLEIEVNARRRNKRNRAVCIVWVGINVPQTKHVPTPGSMGSPTMTIQGKMFQTNVATRVGIDDEHRTKGGRVGMISKG
jgi:hypothetical protein